MARTRAGYYTKANGTMETRFEYAGKTYSVYGKSYEEIEAKKAIRIEELEKEIVPRHNLTLNQYYPMWLADRGNEIKASTIYSYNTKFKRISKQLGKKKLDSISVSDIKEFKNYLVKNMNYTNSANFVLVLLRSILDSAVEEKLIRFNPAENVRNAKASDEERRKIKDKTSHKALTIEQQKKFFEYAKCSWYYELLAVMVLTGMRIDEVAGLDWSDIDYSRNEININKAVSRIGSNEFKISTPKTLGSVRTIPLTDSVKEILKSQRMKNNVLNVKGRIFSSSNNELISYTSVNTSITHIIKKMREDGIQIHHFSSHCLRDTYATRCIEQGMNPQTLKALLGHSKISTTMDRYAQVLPNTKQEEVSRIQIAI